jgi:hypothetical protein
MLPESSPLFETYGARPETSIMTELSGTDGLYLGDLHIGQRFTSRTHVVDEATRFAAICPGSRQWRGTRNA